MPLHSFFEMLIPARRDIHRCTYLYNVVLVCWIFMLDPDLALCQFHSHLVAPEWDLSPTTIVVRTTNTYHILTGFIIFILVEPYMFALLEKWHQSKYPVKKKRGPLPDELSKYYKEWQSRFGWNNKEASVLISDLPEEIWFHVCRYMDDPNDFVNLSYTCKQFHRFINDDILWVRLYERMAKIVRISRGDIDWKGEQDDTHPDEKPLAAILRKKTAEAIVARRAASLAGYLEWFNRKEKVYLKQLRADFKKQLFLNNMTYPPIIEAKLGRTLIRSGPIKLLNQKQKKGVLGSEMGALGYGYKRKNRFLFLFTDMLIIAKLDKNGYIIFSNSLLCDLWCFESYPKYHIYDQNEKQLLLSTYDTANDNMCILQSSDECDYNSWFFELKKLLARRDEYFSMMLNKSNIDNEFQSRCYLCSQRSSLFHRLYWCCKCGSVVCSTCCKVTPYRFQYGHVCKICEAEDQIGVRKLRTATFLVK